MFVALHNDSESIRAIEPGDRIAQLICVPFMKIDFMEVDNLDETDRNTGGFGSTGTK